MSCKSTRQTRRSSAQSSAVASRFSRSQLLPRVSEALDGQPGLPPATSARATLSPAPLALLLLGHWLSLCSGLHTGISPARAAMPQRWTRTSSVSAQLEPPPGPALLSSQPPAVKWSCLCWLSAQTHPPKNVHSEDVVSFPPSLTLTRRRWASVG